MTTLLAGGAGYIGSHMVKRLLEEGEPFVVLDNLSAGLSGRDTWRTFRRRRLRLSRYGA